MTVFLSVVSIQGTATAVADGVAIKTAKFVTGNFIPVVGRMFTDAADTVISASVILKNTIGLAGVGILLFIVFISSIKNINDCFYLQIFSSTFTTFRWRVQLLNV